MKTDFILVAQGPLTTPILNCSMNADTPQGAKDEAAKVCAALNVAGYSLFTLYDVSEEGHHVRLASIYVEQPKPLVTIR